MLKNDIQKEGWTVKKRPSVNKKLNKFKRTNPEMYRKGKKLEQELIQYGQPVSTKIFTDIQRTYSNKITNCWHCHIKAKGPTYVAVWTKFKAERLIVIGYIGTHEKVGDYARYC